MPEKILVVDDEHDIADLLEVYLQNENYIVYKYYTAKDALVCIEDEEIDLAILDIMLPDDPKILVMDEPTAGLDPGERVRLRNFISEFSHDRIVLISTHIVSDIEYISTKNAIMKNGQIVGVGTTSELVKTIEGKVWNCVVPAHKVPEYEMKLRIINQRSEENDQVSIRYLSEQSEITGSIPATPRLEDLYLWLFPYEGDKKEGY